MKGRKALETVTNHKSFFIFSHISNIPRSRIFLMNVRLDVWVLCLKNISFVNWFTGIVPTEAKLLTFVLWALFLSSIIYFLPSLQLFCSCQGRCLFREEMVGSASKADFSFCLLSLTEVPSLLLEMVWLMKLVAWMKTRAVFCHNGKRVCLLCNNKHRDTWRQLYCTDQYQYKSPVKKFTV